MTKSVPAKLARTLPWKWSDSRSRSSRSRDMRKLDVCLFARLRPASTNLSPPSTNMWKRCVVLMTPVRVRTTLHLSRPRRGTTSASLPSTICSSAKPCARSCASSSAVPPSGATSAAMPNASSCCWTRRAFCCCCCSCDGRAATMDDCVRPSIDDEFRYGCPRRFACDGICDGAGLAVAVLVPVLPPCCGCCMALAENAAGRFKLIVIADAPPPPRPRPRPADA
mmetsp:Transcript_3647/g.11464  ORF Transcript_3647/g.11464 Transcript_3647/m.11464 type:complete len:224 (-) Transcript_3647:76-747(-)